MTKVSDRYLEDRRREILEAAQRVFVQKGYGEATMQDVAGEAGIAAGSIYRYFTGKAGLIAAVLALCCEEDRALFHDSAERAPSPLAALVAAGERVGELLVSDAGRDAAILRLESYLAAARDPALRQPVDDAIRESIDMLAEMIRATQQSGELSERVDAGTLSLVLHATVAGLSTLCVPVPGEVDVAAAWDLVTTLVMTLGTAPAGEPVP